MARIVTFTISAILEEFMWSHQSITRLISTPPPIYTNGLIFGKGTFFILRLSELNLKINLTRLGEGSQTNEQDIVVSFEGAEYQPN